ncbi:MAG TPA: hypothetical protein VLC47_05795 [Burkholderiales bacterium]|nr:hypothetical protein [Burkholderiales bacterium]
MVPTREGTQTDREVEAAIARVLEAERAARAAVEAAQHEAEAIRADARTRDKRIAERAAARIAAVRAGMAEKRATRLAALETAAVGRDPQAAEDEAAGAHLVDAVAQLADELIGSEQRE